ncbi:uncharacterized protein LOC121734664 [Aricia agestis]|uniref:uncharacterized protein LOC121734664 n=1 Tax=Aricia agestis TaxID=91739 RepID=UPI001C2039BB|nr:uncharacterized protein LOC121734664 [Aricia agestis]
MSATVQTTIKEKLDYYVEIPILSRCCFCFPLRKGLIAFGYLNFALTLVVTTLLSIYISYIQRGETAAPPGTEYPRLIVDAAGMVLELIMTVLFIVGLHLKHVLLMKIYLYFEIVFSAIGFVYSLAFLTRESAGELFLILFQLTVQMYLVILIWSSIVKMKRNVSVNYMRQDDTNA